MQTPVKKTLGVYIHWPFCESKCPYCDFNSYVSEKIDIYQWGEAYKRSLASCIMEIDDIYEVKSLFFGGGTPSLMPPSLVENIIQQITTSFPCVTNLEISLEANPGSVETQKFYDLRQAGINRLSLGIQALNDQDLKYLGRRHTLKEALSAIEIARQTFQRFSFDLIYARRADHSLKEWEQELKQALSFGSEHLSLYQLTIEPQTAFYHAWKRGDVHLPDEDLAADLYQLTTELTQQAGFDAYEISNYAKAKGQCRHNLIYWRYQDFLGIGPGAHGRITKSGLKMATTQYRAPETWLNEVKENGTGYQDKEEIDIHTQVKEAFLMGLRLSEGVNLESLPQNWQEVLNESALTSMSGDFLEKTPKKLRTTPKGRLCLDAVLRRLFPD